MQLSFDHHIRRQSMLALASRCIRYALLVVLLTAAVLAAGGWLDQWLVLDGKLRLMVLILLLVGLVAVAVLWLRSFRRARGRYLLAELDRAAALDAGYVISTSAEFSGKQGADAVEQAMLARLHQKANELIATTTPRHPWPSAFIVVAAAAGLAALVALFVGHGNQPLLRIFKPWAHQPYTTLTVVPMADPLPVKGEPFVIRGQASGRIPERGVLRTDSGAERAFRIAADGTFEIAFPQGLTTAESAVVRGGKDGVSKQVALAFRVPPEVVNYAHEVVPPSYTGLPTTNETKPSFTIVRGSEVRFGVAFNEQPSAARLVFENDLPPVDLQANPADPRKWLVDLGPVARGFGYRLDVADNYGTFSLADEPQQVVVVPDRPPTIQLVKENSKDIRTRSETLKFDLAAKDDFGLYQIRVQAYRIGGTEGAPKELARLNPTKSESRDWSMKWELDLREMDVKPMDMVVVVFEAVDGNTLDGPGRAFTDPFIFEVPEDAGEGEGGAAPPPGGGAPGEPPEIVNPLAMQRQLYRETLQLTLGRGKLTMNEASSRQQAVVEAIGNMQKELESPSPEFTELLKKAWEMARRASLRLKGGKLSAGDRSPNSPLRMQEDTIQLLIQAAQIQREMQKPQPPPPEGEQPPPPCKPPTKYTLIDPPSASPKNEEEKQNQEEIDKALADIEKARAEQEKINKELEEKAKSDPKESEEGKEGEGKEGEGKEGEGKEGEGKEGEGKEGEGKEGEGKEGEGKEGKPSDKPGSSPGGTGKPGDPKEQKGDLSNPKGDPSKPGDDSELTNQQLESSELSAKIAEQIEKLMSADKQADPKQAAEQMRRAAALQREAAQALLQNAPEKARESGEEAADAIRRAAILTEALLDRAVTPGIDAGTRAPGYDDLIQGYSRRLSYDE
jgi:hypothetical protein